MTGRTLRTTILGGVLLALAVPAGAEARQLPSKPPKPKQYILIDFTSGAFTKLFEYTKTKTWELPEEKISGTYTKTRRGDRFEMVYVGENPLDEVECDMTLLWPVHPKTEQVDPYGTERCYDRSGLLLQREVYVLGDE